MKRYLMVDQETGEYNNRIGIKLKGSARVRDLVEQARKVAPAIIFIDEIDAVDKTRGTAMGD